MWPVGRSDGRISKGAIARGNGLGLYIDGAVSCRRWGILTGSARDLVNMRRHLSKVNDRVDAPDSHP